MRKFIRYFLLLALAVLVVIQFFQPEKNQAGYEAVASFEAETTPSAQVSGILKENC